MVSILHFQFVFVFLKSNDRLYKAFIGPVMFILWKLHAIAYHQMINSFEYAYDWIYKQSLLSCGICSLIWNNRLTLSRRGCPSDSCWPITFFKQRKASVILASFASVFFVKSSKLITSRLKFFSSPFGCTRRRIIMPPIKWSDEVTSLIFRIL